MLAAMEATIARKDLVEHWLLIDDDDPAMLPLVQDKAFEELTTYPQHWIVRPRPRKLADAWNELWSAARGRAGIFIGFTDDYEMKTPGWDKTTRQVLNFYPDRVALGYIPDPSVAEGTLTIICGTSRLFDLLGYFVIPYFPYWFMDSWVSDIALMLLRRPTLEIGLGPQEGERGQTAGMRNLPFWYEFYIQTLDERRETAERIRSLIYEAGGPDERISRQFEEEMVGMAGKLWAKYDPQSLKGLEESLCGETAAPTAAYLEVEADARRHLAERAAGCR
jgi:hypothetical protein